MNWIIGSNSPAKIKTAEKVITQITSLAGPDLSVTGFAADSGVGNTPRDQETFMGAQNRAIYCQAANPKADYWVGLESGLAKRYGHIFEEAWACVISKDGQTVYGYSSGLKVPDSVLARMADTQLEHWQVMPTIRAEKGLEDEKDTWGNYTGNQLLREISLEEALRNALVQLFGPEEAFYRT